MRIAARTHWRSPTQPEIKSALADLPSELTGVTLSLRRGSSLPGAGKDEFEIKDSFCFFGQSL